MSVLALSYTTSGGMPHTWYNQDARDGLNSGARAVLHLGQTNENEPLGPVQSILHRRSVPPPPSAACAQPKQPRRLLLAAAHHVGDVLHYAVQIFAVDVREKVGVDGGL